MEENTKEEGSCQRVLRLLREVRVGGGSKPVSQRSLTHMGDKILLLSFVNNQRIKFAKRRIVKGSMTLKTNHIVAVPRHSRSERGRAKSSMKFTKFSKEKWFVIEEFFFRNVNNKKNYFKYKKQNGIFYESLRKHKCLPPSLLPSTHTYTQMRDSVNWRQSVNLVDLWAKNQLNELVMRSQKREKQFFFSRSYPFGWAPNVLKKDC